MNKERTRPTSGGGSAGKPAPGEADIVYHKAPSFLWVIVPIAALLAYGYFSK